MSSHTLTCLCLSTFLTIPALAQDLPQWSFESADPPQAWPNGCTLATTDGLLRGEITASGNSVWVWLPQVSVPAPVALALRVRTSSTVIGRGEVHVSTHERPGLGLHSAVRFPVPHDDQWHELRVPLPQSGTIRQLRLSVGYGKGSFELDWVRLESDPYPPAVLQAREAFPESLTIQDEALRVTLRPREHLFTVLDQRSGRTWTGNAAGGKVLLAGARAADPRRLLLDLYDHSTRASFTCAVFLPAPGTLTFELDCKDPQVAFCGPNEYPPMLTSDLGGGKLVFCDRSAGVYISQTEPAYRDRTLSVYGNTSTTNLPLVGVLDPVQGDAMMALVETPCDAAVHLTPDVQGRAWPQIHWEESLDTFRYPRRLSYRFAPSGGYVALARLYRDYAASQGHVVPFSRKLTQRPAVAGLRGAPILWGARDAWRFIREARTEGLLAGVLANAQHGLWDDASLRRLNEMGYLTAPYDNVSDALDGPTGPQRDPLAETALHSRPDAGPQGGWEDELNTHFVRSSAFALRALRSYLPRDLERYGYNAWFMDVALAIGLMEDWHPAHTFDRRQDMAYRRECFRELNQQGLVVGAEHGNDWGIEFVDWTEGSLGGPLWWERARAEGWDPGRLRRAVSREDYTDSYLRIGHGYDTRVPFWQLVYHDCAVSTWYWGDGPDFHYDAAPEVSTRKDLQALLYGGVPILWRSDEGYGWERNRERLLQSYRDTCLFHREVAFARLVDHEFLSADAALQRTRFDSGHTAVVNFAIEPREYVTDDGDRVTLAPDGYYVTGPGFRQTRLWAEGAPDKRLEADGYRAYQPAGPGRLGPVDLDGRMVAFRTAPDRWQLALEADRHFRFRPCDLTGWDAGTRCALVALDAEGDARQILRTAASADELALTTTPDERFFALQAAPDPSTVTVYPAGDILRAGAGVVLSAAGPQGLIRYSLDGTEPTPLSSTYAGPIPLADSAVVKARLFSGEQPLGPTTTRELQVEVPLYDSPRLRGGHDALRVDVPVEGLRQLRLRIGDGGDSCWSDWADWADAAFVLADGSRVSLSDLTPVAAKQTYHEMTRDGNPTGTSSIRINGRAFARGLCCFSESLVLYDIPPQARRFEAWVGVDDRGNPGPNGPEVLRGTVTFSVSALRPWSRGPA